MRRARALLIAAALPLLAIGVAASCGEGDTLPALGGAKDDAGKPDAGSGGGGAGGGDGGLVRRTVVERNPYGDVAKAKNLLWDGDFEWSTPFSDEYGWAEGLNSLVPLSRYGYGITCRSGLKCGLVKPNQTIVGIGVSAKGAPLEASFWAKPKNADCTSVTAQLASSLIGAADPDTTVPPKSVEPDADGWCFFDLVVEERTTKTFLRIKNKGSEDLVVDDAALERAPDAMALTKPKGVPTSLDKAELDTIRKALLALGGPHDAPPNEARRAVEAWARQRR